MALFSTIRSVERSPLRRSRSVEDPRSPQTEQAETPFPLPRHLLVSLAGLTADVTSLQQHGDDTPELQEALDTILGKLDHLVDSIYQRAAHPTPPSMHRAGQTAASPSAALAHRAIDPADADNIAHPLNGAAPPLPRPHS